MQEILKFFELISYPTLTLVVLIILLIINARIFNRIKNAGSESAIVLKAAVAFVIFLLGILVFSLTLPIDKTLKGQVVGFLGILMSAGIALSSTTLLGNLIAGIMNTSMSRFKNGDLIKVGEFQGRVIRKSMFHVEIQLEDSSIMTIPNLYIASTPLKLIRKDQSVISATVSLGYDFHRIDVEKALKKAASDAGLRDPYVYITALGDYSVQYKIHGFLEDTNKFFTTQSNLHAMVMDVLHNNGIEIVSPSFLNRRDVNSKTFIPIDKKTEPSREEKAPEELVFDEALKSQEIEKKKEYLKKLEERQLKLKESLKSINSEDEILKIKACIEKNEEIKKQLENNIEEQLKNIIKEKEN